MARVHVVTEGSTENNFVDDVLKPYLAQKGVFLDAHSVTTRRDRRRRPFRGGLINLEHLLKDIRLWLLESRRQSDCFVTTMVDFYAFPFDQRKDWTEAINAKPSSLEKALRLEEKLSQEFGEFSNFIPYVQLHEFEALLLTDPPAIHRAFSDAHNEKQLAALQENIRNLAPEEVDNGPHTAPSKRIMHFYPEYGDNKPTWGALIAHEIGIDAMRVRCPHFNFWLNALENLAHPDQ